jgi:hypothetical protein
MNLKMTMVLIALTLSCFSQSVIAQGNLVVNGDFSAGTAGWTLTNGAFYDGKFGDPTPSLQFVNTDPTANPTASQTINGLTIESIYLVSGNYNDNNYQGNSFRVAMDGVLYFEDNSSGNQNWQNISFFYTATSSSVVLSLSAQVTGLGLYSADNISMIPTPEPSSLCLIGLGGMMSAIFFRKRRKG